MENLTDPFLLLDKEKNTMMANKSAITMFGGQIVNQPVSEYIYDVEVLLAINKAIDTGKSDTVEFMLSNPRPRNYLLRIHVLENSQNDKMNFPLISLSMGEPYLSQYMILQASEKPKE